MGAAVTLADVRDVILHKMCASARRDQGCDHRACKEAGRALSYLESASPVAHNNENGWFLPSNPSEDTGLSL